MLIQGSINSEGFAADPQDPGSYYGQFTAEPIPWNPPSALTPVIVDAIDPQFEAAQGPTGPAGPTGPTGSPGPAIGVTDTALDITTPANEPTTEAPSRQVTAQTIRDQWPQSTDVLLPAGVSDIGTQERYARIDHRHGHRAVEWHAWYGDPRLLGYSDANVVGGSVSSPWRSEANATINGSPAPTATSINAGLNAVVGDEVVLNRRSSRILTGVSGNTLSWGGGLSPVPQSGDPVYRRGLWTLSTGNGGARQTMLYWDRGLPRDSWAAQFVLRFENADYGIIIAAGLDGAPALISDIATGSDGIRMRVNRYASGGYSGQIRMPGSTSALPSRFYGIDVGSVAGNNTDINFGGTTWRWIRFSLVKVGRWIYAFRSFDSNDQFDPGGLVFRAQLTRFENEQLADSTGIAICGNRSNSSSQNCRLTDVVIGTPDVFFAYLD